MRETLEGQCQCGEVRYRVTGTTATLFVCHCTECQRQSSSAFGMALWINEPKVRMLSGQMKEWIRQTPSGARMACRFCPTCGTRLFHQIVGRPEVLSIKPGTLRDTKQLWPVGHIWVDSKQAWVMLDSTTHQYPRDPESFDHLFSSWQAAHADQA
jgi:hypothetical protein